MCWSKESQEREACMDRANMAGSERPVWTKPIWQGRSHRGGEGFPQHGSGSSQVYPCGSQITFI